jgi:hypothetical protein
MSHGHFAQALAALNTPLDENDEVMKLSKGSFLSPRLNLFQCHVIPIDIGIEIRQERSKLGAFYEPK